MKPPAAMVDIAAKIIEQLEGPFDPSQFNDRYEDALRALIKEKQKGHTVEGARGAQGGRGHRPDGGAEAQPGPVRRRAAQDPPTAHAARQEARRHAQAPAKKRA